MANAERFRKKNGTLEKKPTPTTHSRNQNEENVITEGRFENQKTGDTSEDSITGH